MKCLLISFFDSSNIGDLTLSNCLKEQLENQNLDVKTISYSSNIDNCVDINHIPDRKVKDIMGWRHRLKNIMLFLGMKKFLYFMLSKKNFLDKNNLSKLEMYIKESDFVVFGGGNMVFDIFAYSVSAEFLNYFIRYAKKYNKKILVLSIGIGPFNNTYQLKKCIDVLSKVDILTFRDERSKKLYLDHCMLNDKFVKKDLLSADPVFLLQRMKQPTKNNIKKIAINVINPNLIYNEQNHINKVKKLYINLINELSKNYEVVLFATETMDYEFIYELKEEVRFNLETIRGLDDLLYLYNSSDLIIGSRMHSIIIAVTQNIPFYGLIWQTKVESMIEMLGLLKYSCDIRSTNYDEIIENIDCIFRNYNKCTEKLINGIDMMKKRLQLNDVYINEIIKKLEKR